MTKRTCYEFEELIRYTDLGSPDFWGLASGWYGSHSDPLYLYSTGKSVTATAMVKSLNRVIELAAAGPHKDLEQLCAMKAHFATIAGWDKALAAFTKAKAALDSLGVPMHMR